MCHKIKQDAIFIADAHYNKQRQNLSLFLDEIINKNIQTSQIFFMGDIFDFLSSEIDYFKNINKTIIDKINKISNIIEVIYIEGNHDYNLYEIFLNANILKRENQAKKFIFNNHNIIISHGDIYTPWQYNLYTKIIRNSMFLKFLNFINFNNIISKKVEEFLINKNICHHFNDFNDFAKKRISKYNLSDNEILIEGHYHQGKTYKNYINIPSFACTNEYTQITNNKFINIKYEE